MRGVKGRAQPPPLLLRGGAKPSIAAACRADCCPALPPPLHRIKQVAAVGQARAVGAAHGGCRKLRVITTIPPRLRNQAAARAEWDERGGLVAGTGGGRRAAVGMAPQAMALPTPSAETRFLPPTQLSPQLHSPMPKGDRMVGPAAPSLMVGSSIPTPFAHTQRSIVWQLIPAA